MFWKLEKVFLLFFATVLVLIVFSSVCLAQQKLELNYPVIFGQKLQTTGTTLEEYVKYVFNISIALAGIIAFFALIWAGILYFFSFDDPSKAKEARERISAAFFGLIILLSSYIILSTISPQLLIFKFPGLKSPVIPIHSLRSPLVITGNTSLITEELPIGQAAKNGLWEKTRTENLKQLITKFENFLNKKGEISDPELDNNTFSFNKISDLNQYLKSVASECYCSNLTGLCSKPGTGSSPVGCSGDPCQTDQGGGVENDSPRARINKAINIDKKKIETLLEYQQKINKQKNIFREELRKFQDLEAEFISCLDQGKVMETLNEYLTTSQSFKQSGDKLVKIPSYISSNADPLTFYCVGGGTIFDYSPSEGIKMSNEESLSPEEFFRQTTKNKKLSCPLELPIGETLDSLRELAIVNAVNLERTSLLIGQETKEIKQIIELISRCNKKNCEVSCNCIPNPCYKKCGSLYCALFCKPKCLQAIGGCHGEACPTEDIDKKVKKIKETENKIFETLKTIKNIFPRVAPLLEKLNNLGTSTNLCYSSDPINPTWELFNCQQAKGNYGPNGQTITICHPRNFYCCSVGEGNKEQLPVSEMASIYIIPAQKFQDLKTKNNCPEGWLCSDSVKNYNQYKDASEPIKQLLSCMRKKLDALQDQEELKQDQEHVIGKISSISDYKIYNKTCGWETGPKQEGGCSYPYEIRHGREVISAHYGGIYCSYEHKSYAVDFDLSSDFQKKYVAKIIESAKECSPGAYVLDKISFVHIDIGEIYGCGSNDY